MLSPIVRGLEHAGAPSLLSAGLVSLGFITLLGGIGWAVVPDLSDLSEKFPQTMRTIERRARELQEFVRPIRQASDQLQNVGKQVSGAPRSPTVVLQQGSAITVALGSALTIAVQAIFSLALVFFFLWQRRKLRSAMIHVARTYQTKRRLLRMFADIKQRVSRYLLTVLLVNMALGICVAAALSLIQFPNALLWGAAAGLLNFIPYAGSIAIEIAAFAMGLVHYPSIEQALIPPLLIYLIYSLEGYVITPMIVGRRVVLNPLAVFLAIGFGAWVWGIAGAVVAVPGLIVLVCALQHWYDPIPDHVDVEPVAVDLDANERQMTPAPNISSSRA